MYTANNFQSLNKFVLMQENIECFDISMYVFGKAGNPQIGFEKNYTIEKNLI